MEYLLWPEIAIVMDILKQGHVHESRDLNEMNIVTDEIGEEKHPNFLTKLKF